MIDSIKIHPANPVRNDIVNIELGLHTPINGKRLYFNHQLNGNALSIEGCYMVTGSQAEKRYLDTITIGQLPDGVYIINFKGYVSYDTVCKHNDSTFYNDTFVVHAPASIPSIQSTHFILYPSPAYDVLHIRNTTGAILQKASIYDTRGSLQKQYSGKEPLDISTLPAGLYFLYLDTDKGRVMKRFIKE